MAAQNQVLEAREWLKRNAPSGFVKAVKNIKAQFRSPELADVVLHDFRLEPELNKRPRLTLVLPTLRKGDDFGGFDTGIDVFVRMAKQLQSKSDCDVRLIITDVVADTDPTIFLKRAQKAGVEFDPKDIHLHTKPDQPIPVRAHDLFMTYNWWTTLNIASLREKQVAHFGSKTLPMLYIIQDYEPNFYAFSAANLLARGAYDSVDRLWGIFNSSNLQKYFELLGHSVEKGWTFEPVVNDALRPFLSRVADSERKKRLIVYGRPYVERNCFSALVRGLKRWAKDYPQFGEWEVISAGTAHDPIELGDGRAMRSMGKLPLEEYAATLLESSAGVSLMASPHPSYPPLEMAHFGVRVVTNAYTCKDLSGFHSNLISIQSIAERELAQGIAKACEAASSPPSDQPNPVYVRDEKYTFLADLAEAIGAEFTA